MADPNQILLDFGDDAEGAAEALAEATLTKFLPHFPNPARCPLPIRLARMAASDSRPIRPRHTPCLLRPPRACLVGEEDPFSQQSSRFSAFLTRRRMASMLYSPKVPM
jgi:hypothetical protein